MSAPIAGWYPDPAGDVTKLRYWDGVKWTDSYMDAPAATPQAAEAAPSGSPVDVSAGARPATQQPQTQPPAPHDAAAQQVQAQPTYQQVYADPSATAAPGPAPVYSQPVYQQPYVDSPSLYYVDQQDSTLRLIAFILAVLSTVSAGIFLIPLAWMIPMTVMTWGIYKGKRPNTVAFGVCSLIFLNVVGGILLLVSTKDE